MAVYVWLYMYAGRAKASALYIPYLRGSKDQGQNDLWKVNSFPGVVTFEEFQWSTNQRGVLVYGCIWLYMYAGRAKASALYIPIYLESECVLLSIYYPFVEGDLYGCICMDERHIAGH